MTRFTSLEDCPPGVSLLAISVLEQFFQIFNFPQWREFMPFGFGDAGSSTGWLSHEAPEPLQTLFPKLLTYQDFLQQSDSQFSLSTLYKFAFETPSTSLGDTTSPDALILLIGLVLLLRTVKRTLNPLFCSIGRTLGRKTHGLKWEKENEEKIIKFGEYVFRLIYHFSFSLYGILYFHDKPWWDSSRGGTTLLWMDYPYQEIQPGMIWYYLMQCAYNVDAFISLIELSFDLKIQNPCGHGSLSTWRSPVQLSWSSTVRGDFREMFIHHVITNCLVFGSSFFRFTRIGSMVFMVHDISDVPVDLSKLANFVKWTKTTVVCFLSMVIVWVITRMIILPFVIVKSVWYESLLLYTEGPVDARIYKMYFGIFWTLLVGITSLHYFWFTMFIKIARDLTKGKVQDYTEHKNGENADVSSKKTN